MAETKQAKLTQLVEAHIQAQRERAKLKDRLEGIKATRPAQPKAFDSVGDMDRFVLKQNTYTADFDDAEGKLTDCQRTMDTLNREILCSLPIKNSWVRVGDYAVGYCNDTWGGIHPVLFIREWKEPMPDLSDRTYYP